MGYSALTQTCKRIQSQEEAFPCLPTLLIFICWTFFTWSLWNKFDCFNLLLSYLFEEKLNWYHHYQSFAVFHWASDPQAWSSLCLASSILFSSSKCLTIVMFRKYLEYLGIHLSFYVCYVLVNLMTFRTP